MPVLSWGHSQYWANATVSTVVTPALTVYAYPKYQTVILGSGLGAMQAAWERFVAKRDEPR